MTILHRVGSSVLHATSLLIIHTSQALLLIALFLSAAYYCGWIHRFIIFIIESEASKILNRTPVTVGSVRWDLLRGRVWVSNVLIHAPRRHQWQWESPVFGRIGNAYVESNALAMVLRFWFLGEEIPMDLHCVHLMDVQVFVERKQEMFNFYLLDPHVQVPDPVLTSSGPGGPPQPAERPVPSPPPPPKDDARSSLLSTAPAAMDTSASMSSGFDTASITNTVTEVADVEQDKAQKLVDGMLRALGRAAKQGTIHDALQESRISITTHLKALQKSSKNKSEVMQEGVKIVQHVSKQFVEKERQLQQVVQPNRRKLANEKVVYARVGRIVLQDARIFTRDNASQFEKTHGGTRGDVGEAIAKSSGDSCWNTPIYLKQVMFRAAELCPPLSCKDVNNTAFPAVYQPLDKLLQIIQVRMLTEIAKSNTGRVFQTALSEMLDLWVEKSKQDVALANDAN